MRKLSQYALPEKISVSFYISMYVIMHVHVQGIKWSVLSFCHHHHPLTWKLPDCDTLDYWGICSPPHIVKCTTRLSKMAKASFKLLSKAMSTTNWMLCWPRLLTIPTTDHVLSLLLPICTSKLWSSLIVVLLNTMPLITAWSVALVLAAALSEWSVCSREL